MGEIVHEPMTDEEYDAFNAERVEGVKQRGYRVIRSKFGGRCGWCHATFKENDRIIWIPGAPRGRSVMCLDTIACEIREHERAVA